MYDSPNPHAVLSLFLLLHMLVIWQQYHKMAEDQSLKTTITNKPSVSDENIKHIISYQLPSILHSATLKTDTLIHVIFEVENL